MAGGHKHMWSWIVKNDPDRYGKHGFKRPQKTITKSNPINLAFLDEKLDELASKGLAKKEKGNIVVDVTELGYNKVLGKGKITKKATIKSPRFSESAIRKIEEAGGEAVTL